MNNHCLVNLCEAFLLLLMNNRASLLKCYNPWPDKDLMVTTEQAKEKESPYQKGKYFSVAQTLHLTDWLASRGLLLLYALTGTVLFYGG